MAGHDHGDVPRKRLHGRDQALPIVVHREVRESSRLATKRGLRRRVVDSGLPLLRQHKHDDDRGGRRRDTPTGGGSGGKGAVRVGDHDVVVHPAPPQPRHGTLPLAAIAAIAADH